MSLSLKTKNVLIFLVIGFLFISCATGTYIMPKPRNKIEDYQRIIDKNYNDTWTALIQYSASTFFGIENFEKESGLITLSFGAANPGEFVDGGKFSASSMNASFNGDYIDYLVQYANGSLTGKMNVIVVEIDSSQTMVKVSARYVFQAHQTEGSKSWNETWSFDSGGYDVHAIGSNIKGSVKERMLMPTHKAEKAILDALEKI